MKARTFRICILISCLLAMAVSCRASIMEKRITKLDPQTLEQKATFFLSNGCQLRYRHPFSYQSAFPLPEEERDVSYTDAWCIVLPMPGKNIGRQRYAFVTKQRDKFAVVLDGIVQKEFDGIASGDLIFSPDGRRFGYTAAIGKKDVFVVDDKEWPPLDNIDEAAFTTDSKHAFCTGSIGKRHVFIFDGKITEENTSPDAVLGKDCYLIDPSIQNSIKADAEFSRNSCLSIITKRGERFVHTPIYLGARSPNGKRLAFVMARSRNSSSLVLDGRKHELSGEVDFITFSLDSKRFAYDFSKDARSWTIFVDGRKVGEYYNLSDFSFSPDSKHFAYSVNRKHSLVIIDGWKTYDDFATDAEIDDLQWSPNSRDVAYKEYDRESGPSLFMNGKMLYPDDYGDALIFSPDGSHVLCYTFMGDAAKLMLDGKEYDRWKIDDPIVYFAPPIIFSHSGKHVAYTPNGQLVLDKKRITRYDSLLANDQFPNSAVIRTVDQSPHPWDQRWGEQFKNAFFFGSNDSLCYFAARDGWIYQVTQRAE